MTYLAWTKYSTYLNMTIKHFLPLLMVALSLLACPPHDNGTQSSAPLSEIPTPGKNIDQYLTAMEAIGFSGAIVVGHHGEVVLSKGYGFADRAKQIPFTPQTVQSNGSNTKQFTGAAILLLESQGLLAVNDSLTMYVENVPTDKRAITLHQLLTHSSGLLQGVGYDEDPIEFEPFLDRLMAEPLEFEPGTSYNYSNAGYSLLAHIVERVSGVKYERFIRENLLKPSGMLMTGYVLPQWNPEHMAMGYQKGKQWGKVYQNGWIEDGPGWHLRGNGGLHTTVEDMYQWLATLQGNGALDKGAVEKWTRGYVPEPNGFSHYGYGLVSYKDDKWGKVITHNGSNGIFTSEFFWLPEKAFFFYIHANNSIMPAYSLEEDLLGAAFDKAFHFPPIIDVAFSIAPKTVRKKEGNYHHPSGSIALKADDIRLIGKIRGQGVLDVLFENDEAQREKFASLNAKVERAMNKLEQGKGNAFEEMVISGETSQKVSHSFRQRIIQMGRKLESLNVIGSFENPPGSNLYKYGLYTTFVHARFEDWNQYWNLVWSEAGVLQGNFSGPWPEFTLIPIGEERFTGMRGTSPWNTVEVEFQGDCLMIEHEQFCRKAGTAE